MGCVFVLVAHIPAPAQIVVAQVSMAQHVTFLRHIITVVAAAFSVSSARVLLAQFRPTALDAALNAAAVNHTEIAVAFAFAAALGPDAIAETLERILRIAIAAAAAVTIPLAIAPTVSCDVALFVALVALAIIVTTLA